MFLLVFNITRSRAGKVATSPLTICIVVVIDDNLRINPSLWHAGARVVRVQRIKTNGLSGTFGIYLRRILVQDFKCTVNVSWKQERHILQSLPQDITSDARVARGNRKNAVAQDLFCESGGNLTKYARTASPSCCSATKIIQGCSNCYFVTH